MRTTGAFVIKENEDVLGMVTPNTDRNGVVLNYHCDATLQKFIESVDHTFFEKSALKRWNYNATEKFIKEVLDELSDIMDADFFEWHPEVV